jgi:hypothetical protein
MTPYPDDPGRRSPAGGRGRGGRHPAPSLEGLGRPGETTEPMWVLVSIVLGLVALTGLMLLFLLAGFVTVLVWVFNAQAGDRRARGARDVGRPPGGPLG